MILYPSTVSAPYSAYSAIARTTRNVLTFVNTTAIAYCQNSAFLLWSWHYAIAVVFTNVRTLRVYDTSQGDYVVLAGEGTDDARHESGRNPERLPSS